MFELLLQADRSLSQGLLDQAERTYWQLIELDPTNSIAVAGLARIALLRGDERLARTFADRALGIDPDSIVARRVIQEIEEGASAPPGPSSPELPLRGAERLEALSRRRAAPHEGDEGAEGARPAGATSGTARPKTTGRAGAGTRGVTPPQGNQSRGGARSDEFGPMPSEPLRERRRTGRLAAAAAAAAAAVREPSHARHEPHHAMPSGRHLFQPEMLKAPPHDPFSDAEMAAAVAAVDSLDEPFEGPVASRVEIGIDAEAAAAPGLEVPAGKGEGDTQHVLEAVDATGADESVSLRIALLSGTEGAPADREAPAGQLPGRSIEESEADAAAEALGEVADNPLPVSTEPARPARGGSEEPHDEESSEEEAEMQALHEAMAIVMADDEQGGAGEGSAQPAGPEADVDAVPADAGATAATTGPVGWAQEEPPDAEASASMTRDAENPPRKKGLFRRFRGS